MDIHHHHHPPIYLCVYIYIYTLLLKRSPNTQGFWMCLAGELMPSRCQLTRLVKLRSRVPVVCWDPMVDQIRATTSHDGWYPLQIASTGHRMNQLCFATGLQVRSRYVEASWTRGIPKSFMFIAFSFVNHPAFGVPPFMVTPIYGNPHLILCNHNQWLCITTIHH